MRIAVPLIAQFVKNRDWYDKFYVDRDRAHGDRRQEPGRQGLAAHDVPCARLDDEEGQDWMIVEARPYAFLPPTPMAKK
jgi:hypothetical protein